MMTTSCCVLQGEVKADKPVKISLKSANEERQEPNMGARRAEQVNIVCWS